jgi:hypothetical protein
MCNVLERTDEHNDGHRLNNPISSNTEVNLNYLVFGDVTGSNGPKIGMPTFETLPKEDFCREWLQRLLVTDREGITHRGVDRSSRRVTWEDEHGTVILVKRIS